MEISLIIIGTNERGLLKYCLRGLKRFPPSIPFEVIVVDNASRDGTQEMLQGWLDASPSEKLPLKVISNRKNLGYTAANNLALQQAQGKYVALLNADIFLLPEA